MIISFSIKNFKSIKEKITLSFEATSSSDLEAYYIINGAKNIRLLKLGLIYGANASGKTTILSALDFLRRIILNPFAQKISTFDFSPFLFDEDTANKNSFFTLAFIQNKVKYSYEIELNKNAIIAEKLYFYKPNKALVYKRETETKKQLSKITFGNKIKFDKKHETILEANTLWNNTVLGGYLKTNFESYELQEVIDWFKNKLKPLITPKTDLLAFVSDKLQKKDINKNNIVEFIKKADFGITDIHIEENENKIDSEMIKFISKRVSISNEEFTKIRETGKIESKEIYFQHAVEGNSKYMLSYFDESEGTQRYYQFSGLLDLMAKSESIFSIDELESSLHPDLLKHFLLTFLVNIENSQLIATTHHRELLMERDILRNDVIWFTEKQPNGNTDLFSLADFDSSVIRNTSSIYNAYKVGKLGATPNLVDYYIDLKNEKK